MSPAKYQISFDKIETVLKEFDLFRMKGVKTLSETGVSDEFKSASIREKYFKAYNTAIANYDFDFLLADQSFFQFEYRFDDELELRYSFFQNPMEFITYEDYLLKAIETYGLDDKPHEIGYLLFEEYEQYPLCGLRAL